MTDLSKIEEIYHAALDTDPSLREAFLRSKCGDNASLRREVESLLAFDTEAASFIETPPDDLAASVISGSGHEMVGREIDHYRVMAELGSGGMGEVYLAEDTKLKRKVALKVLPTQFSTQHERKKRFEQEALAISALNHRNIITIHDIGEFDGMSFLTTEYVDGQTLRAKIASGPINWPEAVEIASQIASALTAAHKVGIIHRDIKPANIMVRPDGEVKVLDFGLAKLTAPDEDRSSFNTRDHTAPNRVMGTVSYMSPEQALGEVLDERTDIFSLGVVMYEMLSGLQPFAGLSDAAVYNATINKTPPQLRTAEIDVPPALEYVCHRALAKDPGSDIKRRTSCSVI